MRVSRAFLVWPPCSSTHATTPFRRRPETAAAHNTIIAVRSGSVVDSHSVVLTPLFGEDLTSTSRPESQKSEALIAFALAMTLEQVGCLAIALSALFEDTDVNAFVDEFRPAMWTEARKTLPKSVFEYSRKALRKALVTLRSAYGPVGYGLGSDAGTR